MNKHKNSSNWQSENQTARATKDTAAPRPGPSTADLSRYNPSTADAAAPSIQQSNNPSIQPSGSAPEATPTRQSSIVNRQSIHSSGTRTGKVARLPAAIRHQLNQRLCDNEGGPALLNWLNSFPEVQAILAKDFDAVPISQSNLYQWKRDGYRAWLLREDVLALARNLDDKDLLGDEALTIQFTEKLTRWLSLNYASAAMHLLSADDLDPDTRWRHLRHLCSDLAQLRRGDHQAQRLALERDRLELDCQNTEWQRKKDTEAAQLRVLTLSQLATTPSRQTT